MDSILSGLSEKVFDSFKKVTPALVSVAILTGFLLFLPQSILERMKLDKLPDLWTKVIGILFLLSIALIITIGLFSLLARIHRKLVIKKIKENCRKKLKTLSSAQKSIIFQLLNSPNKTIELDKNSGDTIFLEQNLFIHMPDQVFSIDVDNKMRVTYVPQLWLLELYNEEPNLFK